jgi:hypothetical protein
MKSITTFDNFRPTLNEETTANPVGYNKVDVENAFRNIEDDLSDHYSIDEDSASIKLDWTLKYGSLDVESSLDHIEFDFDVSGFTRALIRNLEQNDGSKGPRFSKSEIERAISIADSKFDVFGESIDFNINEINTNIEVNENRYSTELTVTGSVDEDSVDLSEAKIDTDAIIERIQEELLKGIINKIDYSS